MRAIGLCVGVGLFGLLGSKTSTLGGVAGLLCFALGFSGPLTAGSASGRLASLEVQSLVGLYCSVLHSTQVGLARFGSGLLNYLAEVSTQIAQEYFL